MTFQGDDYLLAGEAPVKEPARQAYYIAKLRRHARAFEEEHGRKPYGCVRTFGCQMNARDSEKFAGILREGGFILTEEEAEADVVLMNTCTVRENAANRVFGRLGQLTGLKKKRPWMVVGICGCLAQEDGIADEIRTHYRVVDLVFGTHNLYKFAEYLDKCLSEHARVIEIEGDSKTIMEELPNERKYRFKAGVNIMFGCDNFCTYCIVPHVRGREKSRRPEDILDEVRRLAADGVTEVMLLGQNVNSYGKGLEEPITFAQLLRQVCEVEGIRRVRFMTSHPKDLSDELIQAMAECPKVCRQLHLPLQSGSSSLLKRMNRRYTKESYLALVERIRAAIPDISLSTDIIVGFPGETEEDFEETMDVVRRVRYDSAFTFLYSRRSGTPAADFPDQVSKEVAQPRFDRLLALVQEIAAEKNAARVGTVEEALVEEADAEREGYVTGRLSGNTMVHFPGDPAMIGTIVPVHMTESKGFYYMGEVASC